MKWGAVSTCSTSLPIVSLSLGDEIMTSEFRNANVCTCRAKVVAGPDVKCCVKMTAWLSGSLTGIEAASIVVRGSSFTVGT